jgi:hypothetical protein
MHKGYVKVWRKIEDSGLMQAPNTLALFLHILFNATHKDRKLGTPGGVIDLKRGQFVSGRIELAKVLKQSEQQVRTSLKKLENLKIITIQSTNKYSVYTIENYSKYQDEQPTDNQQNNQQVTSKQPTDNQQVTTKQECNNLRIEELNKKQTANASRLPVDWVLNDVDRKYCETKRPDLNPNDIAEQFKNYWIAKSGKDATKLDWSATWRNWVLNQKQTFSQKNKPKSKMDISGMDYTADITADGRF